ncbi:MAG: disulfide bond formation protein B [Candidatus Saccharimonadales bacterium]
MNKLKELINSKLFWLQVAFLLSLSSALGSLILEHAMNLLPCTLCWWQRIFMYPLPFILGVALLQKRFDIFWYAFPIVIVGAGIALYHYLLQIIPRATDFCGPSVLSCTERQTDLLGFITIPFGSLLAFIGIGTALLMLKKRSS